ncbi:MAG: mercuric reductase [Candidatus Hydrogenedentes bacterium]|nr:mercuric reductase [Candidatus Hydrogenedentota bacterium]
MTSATTTENGFTPALSALQPFDIHNQELQGYVHPPNWRNPTPSGRYNLVVIGAGPAGLVAAGGAAGLGAKVALIERSLMGGDCLNVGCVPSKALIRCARAVADLRGAAECGVTLLGQPQVDFAAVMERMRRIRAGLGVHDSLARFTELGVDVYLGDAMFTSRGTLSVKGQTIKFSRALISTGSRAIAPPIDGLEEAGYLSNETVFSLTELPARLAVIGAGPIGCEMAQVFARLGSKVTLVEAAPHILPREDAGAAQIVESAMTRDGVKIICGGKAVNIHTAGREKILHLNCGGEEHEVRVDHILIGVGRAPNVETLNLDAAAVEYDTKRGVHVNDYLQTSNPSIYAAGDAASVYKFTHAADAMARIVIRNALFFGRDTASSLVIPWCTYTDPEVAHVGLSEQDAEKCGLAIQTIAVPLSIVDRAIVDGEGEGFLRLHLKKGSDRILGATLVARHAGDMISEITVMMTAGKGLSALAKTIHPYPTQAEVIKKAADAYNRQKLTPTVKKVFQALLAWRR